MLFGCGESLEYNDMSNTALKKFLPIFQLLLLKKIHWNRQLSGQNYKSEKDMLISPILISLIQRAKKMHDNGQVKFLRQFKNGKHDGLSTGWYENGQKKFEYNYKDNRKYGRQTKWRENGQKEWEGNYKNDKRDGLETYWHENGQRKFVQKHKDGKPVGLWIEWYENGKASEQINYKDGSRISVEVWKPNGERCPETNFINGTGTIVNYRQNGQRLFVQNYKNGKLDGLWIQYGVDGTKVQEAKFKNGLREWIH